MSLRGILSDINPACIRSRFRNLIVEPPRVFGLLLKVSWLYWKRLEQRARALDLTLPECKVLIYLAINEGVSQIRLAQLTDIEPMTLVRTLDRLESHGSLERRRNRADRRARYIYLRADGRLLADEIRRSVELTRQEAFAGIPKRHAALIVAVLEKMQRNFASPQPLPKPADGSLRGRARLNGRPDSA
jgi:MarR family transcriptional regulator, transcriptional regulator for hemolysin